jgi:hypothetical protein
MSDCTGPLVREGALREETRTSPTKETLKSGHGPTDRRSQNQIQLIISF